MKRFIHGWILSASLAVAGGAHAEVVVNGSGQPLAGNIQITPDMGVTHGGNLFHSFSVFNVLTSESGTESVVFSGPDSIRNVISRVTGGISDITHLKSSLINGPVTVNIDGANFYFINPNGVIFGANGSVNATGSVYVSTADYVKFGDGNFYANDPNNKTSVLSSVDPVAFGFLSASPKPIQPIQPITLNGTQIAVPSGKTFALVGGNIDLQADDATGAGTAITAPGATVSLVSVASVAPSGGDVGLAGLSNGTVDLSGFPTLGQIRLSKGSGIDVSGEPSGSIYIRGGQLTLSASYLVAQNGGNANGGVIDIAVRGDLAVEADPEMGPSVILADTYDGNGKGPGINLDVGGTLRVSDLSYVTSASYGPGQAGDIYIHASAIEVQGLDAKDYFTGISAENWGDNETGPSLTIDVGSLQALDGGIVGTINYGSGKGGDLTIKADSIFATGAGSETASLSTESKADAGDAGKLTLNTHTLELRDGARVSSSTAGFGAAGKVKIVADERISISGELSGIFSQTNAPDAGDAGALNITTPLLLVDGGLIDSSTLGNGNAGAIDIHDVVDLRLTGGAQIRSFSGGYDQNNNGVLVVGKGDAGTVSVDATGSVTASGSGFGRPSGLLAETRGAGAGGAVNVHAASLSLSDGATISSSSLGSGVAGDVTIHLDDSMRLRAASIATQATSSDGGNITITAPRLIHLVDSRITTSVGTGKGGGGNIFIDPQFVVLQNSQIIANAFKGPGGTINIIAGQFISDPATVIEAVSKQANLDGTVNIIAPDSDVSADLAVLPDSFLDAARLMQAGCGAARAGLSSLVEVGRGGLPSAPDDYLASLDLDAVVRTGGAGTARLHQSGRAIVDLSAAWQVASAAAPDCRH